MFGFWFVWVLILFKRCVLVGGVVVVLFCGVFWLRAVCFVVIEWCLRFSCFVLRCVAVCFSLFSWLLLWLLLGACLVSIGFRC